MPKKLVFLKPTTNEYILDYFTGYKLYRYIDNELTLWGKTLISYKRRSAPQVLLSRKINILAEIRDSKEVLVCQQYQSSQLTKTGNEYIRSVNKKLLN